MNLQQRKELLTRLGSYMGSDEAEWQSVKRKAFTENGWFIPQFIRLSVQNIVSNFLQAQLIQNLIDRYQIPAENDAPQKVGIVMAGNIPLVGFHDLFCVFLTGHHARIKPSSKDEVLIRHLVMKLIEWNSEVKKIISLNERIPDCGAYIATGSNNSSRYFEYYFQKYPGIIRKNRTSVAVLTGNEPREDLQKLSDDVYQYFGLGCRNVTKIFVPQHYDFTMLLEAFKKYDYLIDHNKYKNNYDYNLAIHMLNNEYYMTNGSILLVEDERLPSPISQLNYQYYTNEEELKKQLRQNENIQCIVNTEGVVFGEAQRPGIEDYADGVNTIKFLMNLGENR